MIDWEDMVKEYKKQYDDEDGIHEFIDSLLPVYYGDIYSTYHEYIGTPLNIDIENEHVGMQIWQIMTHYLFEEFLGLFWSALHAYEEEEEWTLRGHNLKVMTIWYQTLRKDTLINLLH